MRKLIKEFKAQDLHIKYRDEIEAWFQYLDQCKFSEKLEEQMIEEIKRYLETRDKKILDNIVEVVWNETGTEAWIKQKSLKELLGI